MNTLPTSPPLLSTAQMAEFVASGMLAFPGVIDDELNAAASEECDEIAANWGTADRPFAPTSGDPWASIYPAPSAIGAVLRTEVVRGIVASLVGDTAVFDHDFIHIRPAGDPFTQPLHADAVIDPNTAFDIQLFYFPHSIEPGEGGTGYVPGTHLRRVHETQVGRYRHMAGEQQWSGPAGSVLVFHHGLWHRGMSNASGPKRTMYKIRLNPTEPQVRMWDTGDLEEANPANDHIFATFDPTGTAATLRHRQPWMGAQDHRLETMARASLWRYLTGDDDFDVDWYHTRLERRAELS